MDTPQPDSGNSAKPSNPSDRPQRLAVGEVPLDTWVRLREELSELNARLQYLRLMVRLGLRRIQ